MNQRNLQMLVRGYQGIHGLKPGDPIDWEELIGPGKYLEKKPKCPIHGDDTDSAVVPKDGTLVAPCKDPAHRPPDPKGW